MRCPGQLGFASAAAAFLLCARLPPLQPTLAVSAHLLPQLGCTMSTTEEPLGATIEQLPDALLGRMFAMAAWWRPLDA